MQVNDGEKQQPQNANKKQQPRDWHRAKLATQMPRRRTHTTHAHGTRQANKMTTTRHSLHIIATQAYPGLTAQHTSTATSALRVGPTRALIAMQAIATITANNDIANTTPTECTKAVVDKLTGDMMELPRLILGPDRVEWIWSTANEFGRLAKGLQPRMPMGSQTMRYIYHHELPKGRKATYSRFVASERPHKVE
jgi:hypothetical protein